MRTKLMLAFIICVAAVPAFGQIGLSGKWGTDHPTDPPRINDVHTKQSVQLELIVQDGKASGSLQFGALEGMYYKFQDGKVIGNKVLFRTDALPGVWAVEMLDDTTIMIYQERNQISCPGVQAATAVESLPPLPIHTAAFTQARGSGSIIGTVADRCKALIPGVTVTATNDDSGTESTTNTNEAGVYSFSGLPPGKYTITATLPGFKTTPGSNIRIKDTEVRQDFTIDLAAQAPANPTAASCSTNEAVWCSFLYRAK